MNVSSEQVCHAMASNVLEFIAENKIRYTRFDPDELARVACEAMGAHSCTVITKLEEGISRNSTYQEIHMLIFKFELIGLLQQSIPP